MLMFSADRVVYLILITSRFLFMQKHTENSGIIRMCSYEYKKILSSGITSMLNLLTFLSS
jgi:hypothetical protein